MTVSAFALLPGFARAQNYVPANSFSGPNVVIDFAALDQAHGNQNQMAAATVVEENLPMPAPAPRLTPPAPKQAMMGTMPPAAPPVMQEAAFAAPPSLPPRDDFSARDMLDAAPSAPLPVATKSATPFNADNGNIRTRAMLASARNDSKDQHGRINLANISSAPPIPTRDTAPLASSDHGADSYKPVTETKPKPIATPPQPETRSAFADNAPILPPQKDIPMPSERDLGMLDEELPSPSTTKSIAKEKPMQVASLSLPTPQSIDAKKPVSANAGKHFTLNFTKESGNLDNASKAELDKIAKALKQDETLRAQVRAYASGSAENSGQARRLSLTRALAARTYVLDQNIPATRLDIRALGNGQGGVDKPTGGSLDKVEITLVN
ncbi:MAG TPA: OmpA family protein [Alphaproteobacteria bacterium]